jgi:hypothetical protein
MNLLIKFLTVLVIILPAIASGQTCTSLDTLHWMLGNWQQEDGKKITTETWTKVSSQTYDGSAQTLSKTDDKITFFESLRLVEMAGGLFYLAKVSHNEFPVPFKLTECSESRAVFINQTHDFPKKIVYQISKDGKILTATVSNEERQFMVEHIRFEGK